MNIDKAGLGHRTIPKNYFFQMALIVVIWQIGESLAHLAAVPVPGSIAGMLLLLFLLHSGLLDLSSIKRGADWFLAEMLLFFVPAVLVVLDHPEFLGWTGLKILGVIVCGTFVVMTCTALTIEICFRLMPKNERGSHVHV
ncbi:MAG: CidA/LrgA family protein [Herbaspirillum sp.]|jgi:holin-like protein|nr:CidA/LrgA family protein [Herbaspirillum sp.]